MKDDDITWYDFLNDMERDMEEMREAELAEQELKKERVKFAREYVIDVLDIVFDFYPESAGRRTFLEKDLNPIGEHTFDVTCDILVHYLRNEPGVYRERPYHIEVYTLHESPHEIRHACYGMPPEYREQHYEGCMTWYFSEFYYASCRNAMFRTIKKLVVKYFPQVFDMPSEGFCELEEELFGSMGVAFAHIKHSRPD